MSNCIQERDCDNERHQYMYHTPDITWPQTIGTKKYHDLMCTNYEVRRQKVVLLSTNNIELFV